MCTVLINKTIHNRIPRINFSAIAEDILPKKYELSLTLIADTLGRRLNKEYKNRDYPTNVLSFPLSESSGEIFINTAKAKREAKHFNHTYTEHVKYLFIHGCLHLSGLPHGEEMDKMEEKYMRKF